MLVWDQRWLNRFNEVQPGLIAVDVFGASILDVWACITMTFIKGVVHSGNVVLSSMNDIQDTDIVLHFLFCIKTKYSGSIKCTLKLISSSLLTFWLTTYLLCFSAPLLTCSFIRTQAGFIQGFLNDKNLARSFNFTFRLINDAL